MIEKKASQNDQYMVLARADAQTAFNKAIASLKVASIDPNENYDAIVSHRPELSVTNKWTDADTETLIEKLKTVVNGHTYYELPDKCYEDFAAADLGVPSWIYINNDSGIVGRMAYVIVSDKGKIDAWAVIDSGTTSNNPPSEVDYGGGITSIAPDGTQVIGRPGRNLTEISLASLEADSLYFSDDYTKKMSVATAGGDVAVGDTGRWNGYEDMFSKEKLNITDHDTQYYFKSVFYENNPPDAEAFWIDNSDSLMDTNELYHRFNLTRADWSTLKVGDFTNVKNIGTLFKSSLDVSKGETDYLPWLKNWKDKGGFECADSARNQIIANLIDYCDADTNATTDFSISYDKKGNLTSYVQPTYVGLERCPYINEVMIAFTCDARYDDNKKETSIAVNSIMQVELADMYGISGNVSLMVCVDSMIVEYEWGDKNGSWGTDKKIIQTNTPYKYNFNGKPKDYYYQTSGSWNNATSLSIAKSGDYVSNDIYVKLTIKDLCIRIGPDDNNLYDYSRLPNTPLMTVSFKSGGETKYLYVDWQVVDPRQNLNPIDWGTPDSRYVLDIGTCGAVNTNFIPNGTDKDPEPNADEPWQISTAYIRNGPMKSPWELGFIHRAQKFQTLNLKRYNDRADNGYGFQRASGGQAYAGGDANILDQIKMSFDKEAYGKININSRNKSVLRALFDHIAVGCLPENPGKNGNLILSTKAKEIAEAVDEGNGGDTKPGVLTRASIVNEVLGLSNGTLVPQDTDRAQEEIIGKFINLTKAESSEDYVVIAVGEAIRDVGGTSFDKYGKPLTSPSVKGTYEPDVDEVLATQKIFALVKHDYKKGTFYIQRMFYLTD